jgi:hypothetical protein
METSLLPEVSPIYQFKPTRTFGRDAALGAMLACHERWEGDRLHFEAGTLGQKMTGRLDILEDSVRIEVDLPAILATLAERIVDKLKHEGQKLLK